MSKLSENLTSIKTSLTSLLTDSNTDEISRIAKDIDSAIELSSTMEKETQGLKDKIVEMVATSITTKAPEEPNPVEKAPKSIDDAMADAINEVVSKRKS